MSPLIGFILIIASALEVGGDAVIRKGLSNRNWAFITFGFIVLGCYGLMVNLVKWDFSKLLGVYVAVFAVMSVLTGMILFKEKIPSTTWIGLAFILIGAFFIQLKAN